MDVLKFKLEITLGNDAVQSYYDIRNILLKLHGQIKDRNYLNEEPESGDGFKLFDANGNSVGYWEITS